MPTSEDEEALSRILSDPDAPRAPSLANTDFTLSGAGGLGADHAHLKRNALQERVAERVSERLDPGMVRAMMRWLLMMGREDMLGPMDVSAGCLGAVLVTLTCGYVDTVERGLLQRPWACW